ncbi:MAG TPA: AraC family transcriptional regulator [Agriterribacter sp.]|nr:AraC family transcriptional regulator [Agriterribacter sp.]
MKVLFPPQYAHSMEIFHQCPPHCIHKIPFATPLYVTSALGDFVSQSVNDEAYWIELLTISLRKDGFINLQIESSFVCLAIILNGSIPDQIIGNGILNFPDGTFNFFYLPKGLHPILLPSSNYTVLYIVPESHYFRKLAEGHPDFDNLLKLQDKQSRNGSMLKGCSYPYRILRILKDMKTGRYDDPLSLDLTLRRYMLEILELYHRLSKMAGVQLRTATSKEKAYKVRDYILLNINNYDLGGLTELAARFNITPKTLTRKFKTLFGQTVPGLIRHERLERGYALLTQSELSVQEIAEKIGYAYPTHFSEDFKAKYGCSPMQLRNKNNNDNNKGTTFMSLFFDLVW